MCWGWIQHASGVAATLLQGKEKPFLLLSVMWQQPKCIYSLSALVSRCTDKQTKAAPCCPGNGVGSGSPAKSQPCLLLSACPTVDCPLSTLPYPEHPLLPPPALPHPLIPWCWLCLAGTEILIYVHQCGFLLRRCKHALWHIWDFPGPVWRTCTNPVQSLDCTVKHQQIMMWGLGTWIPQL